MTQTPGELPPSPSLPTVAAHIGRKADAARAAEQATWKPVREYAHPADMWAAVQKELGVVWP